MAELGAPSRRPDRPSRPLTFSPRIEAGPVDQARPGPGSTCSFTDAFWGASSSMGTGMEAPKEPTHYIRPEERTWSPLPGKAISAPGAAGGRALPQSPDRERAGGRRRSRMSAGGELCQSGRLNREVSCSGDWTISGKLGPPRPSTRSAVFEAIPDQALDAAISDGHRDLRRLAWHLVEVADRAARAGWGWWSPAMSGSRAGSSSRHAGGHGRHGPGLPGRLRGACSRPSGNWSDADLEREDDMYGEPLRGAGQSLHVLVVHQVHHRGQMTVLMRQAGLQGAVHLRARSRRAGRPTGCEPPAGLIRPRPRSP